MTKNIPWLKEFPTDELKEIATLSLLERGAYFSLKLIYHTNEEAFSNEQILFAMCLAFSDEERTAVQTVVSKLFQQSEKTPFNERLNDLELLAVKGISQKSLAGKKSGEARRSKRTAVQTISESESESELDLKLELKLDSEREAAHSDFQGLKLEGQFLRLSNDARLPLEVAERSWDKWKIHRASEPPEDLLANWGIWALNEKFTQGDKDLEVKSYSDREKNIDELGRLKWKKNRGDQLTKSDLNKIKLFEARVCAINWSNLQDYKDKWSTNLDQFKEQIKKKAIDNFSLDS